MLEITKSFGPPAVAGRLLWIKVCPSIRLSFFLAVLLELAHYCSFSENLYGVRGPYGDLCDSPVFWENSSQQKWPNVQKWPKNWFFGLFRKMYSLVLSGNGVERKHLWPHLWEKSCSQVKAKNALSQSDFIILWSSISH